MKPFDSLLLGMIQDEASLRKHLIQHGPPFPYKVVKALDPVIYRNMEFDVWLDSRRRINRARRNEIRQCRYRPGDHCLAKLSLYNNGEQLYSVIVQEVRFEF